MSLVDTWYIDIFYKQDARHDIWWYNAPFGKHDTNMISQKIKLWYIVSCPLQISCPVSCPRRYHVLIHMIYGHDTGVAWPGIWDDELSLPLLLFHDIITYLSVSCYIMLYHVISSNIMAYHVIFSIIWYQYHVVSCYIMWYQACEARRPQRERERERENVNVIPSRRLLLTVN